VWATRCFKFDLDSDITVRSVDAFKRVQCRKIVRLNFEHLSRDMPAMTRLVDKPRGSLLVREPDNIEREGESGSKSAADSAPTVQTEVRKVFLERSIDEYKRRHVGFSGLTFELSGPRREGAWPARRMMT
jgi:hypothetical protein